MRKLTKNQKLIILGAIVVLGVVLYNPIKLKLINTYWYYKSNGETHRDIPSGPNNEDLAAMEKDKNECPFLYSQISDVGDTYELTNYGCSWRDGVKYGEEMDVNITTTDFAQGKKEFQDLLASKGLSESSTLRITYTHKPR